MMCVTVEIKWT